MNLSRAIVTLSIAASSLVGASSASAETAYPAAAFKDSIGVNTKLAAPQTAYYNRGWWDRQTVNERGQSAAADVKKLIASLGIKHIRYDFCPTAYPNCRRGNETAKMLYDTLGVRSLDAYFGSSADAIRDLGSPAGITAEVTENLDLAASYAGADGSGPIEALEGPNEFDRLYARYGDWAARLSHAQSVADGQITAGPNAATLSPLTFLSAPLGVPSANLGATRTLTGWGGNSTFRPWSSAPLDAANQHFYTYFECPETAVQGAATSASCSGQSMPRVQCPTALNPIWLNCANMITGPSKPVWVTEAGYTTSPNTYEGVSGAVSAAYLPRLLLEAWRQQADPGRRAWARTYLYELIDSREGRYCGWNCDADREAGHGLATASYGLKHQGRALRNLLATLDDPGAAPSDPATAADVGVSPADQTQVRRLLFRKASGQLVLAIWRPVKLWQNGTRQWWGAVSRGRELNEGAPVSTTITLPAALPVSISRPSRDEAAPEPRAAATTHVVPARGDVTLVTIG